MVINRAFSSSDNRLRFFEDFASRPPLAGIGSWNLELFGMQYSGTGASVAETSSHVDSTNKAFGVMSIATGTTDTGRACFSTAPAAVIPGLQNMEVEMRVIVQTLSTVAEEYSCSIGFHDALINATLNATDGAWFRYHRAVDGDFWVCCTANNSDADPTSPTNFKKTVTAVAPSVSGGRMQRLKIKFSNGGTVVEFFIDGVLVATHSDSTVPSARNTALGGRIFKSVGTTGRSFWVDYVDLYLNQKPTDR